MITLFEYIKKELETKTSVSLHNWGNETKTEFYNSMNKFYDPSKSVVRYDGETYIISFHGATNGSGGMDQGSPDTFIIKKINEIIDVTKTLQRPTPVENPDFTPLIEMLEATMNSIVDGSYYEDNDDEHHLWEEAMNAVYGKNIFDWWNKNAY